jgi:hypothetical protein
MARTRSTNVDPLIDPGSQNADDRFKIINHGPRIGLVILRPAYFVVVSIIEKDRW